MSFNKKINLILLMFISIIFYSCMRKTKVYVSKRPSSSTDTSVITLNVPSTIQEIKFYNISANSISLSWADTTNAEGYIIERGVYQNSKCFGFKQIANLAKGKVNFTDSGLNPNSTYCYKIKAYNSIALGAYSKEYIVSTLSNSFCSQDKLQKHFYELGSGTADNPYKICSALQLNEIGVSSQYFDKYFMLMSDIDLSSFSKNTFNIIGSLTAPFRGVFDGGGYKIIGLEYKTLNQDNIGLFGVVGEGGVIKNLKIENFNIRGVNNVGALVGHAQAKSLLENITVSDVKVYGDSVVGGIAGIAHVVKKSSVSKSYVEGLKSTVGGITGYLTRYIEDTYFLDSEIKSISEHIVGGIAGYFKPIEDDSLDYYTCGFKKVHSNSNINGLDYVGGILGQYYITWFSDICAASISDSYFIGNIIAQNNVGGISGNGLTIINTYFNGTIKAQDYVGGMSGQSANVITSYALGQIEANNYVGGMIGSSGSVYFSYSNNNIKAKNTVGGICGYSCSIQFSYSKSQISASGVNIGGLVGINNSTIFKSYASNSKLEGVSNLGGLVGDNTSGTITDSFWDKEISSVSAMCGIEAGTGCNNSKGLLTSEMKNKANYTNWDFCDSLSDGPSDQWCLNSGEYPSLFWQNSPPTNLGLRFSSGSGSPEDPYVISTKDQLNSIGDNQYLQDKHFKISSDISLDGISFNTIGQSLGFCGSLNGDNHTISNISTTLFNSIKERTNCRYKKYPIIENLSLEINNTSGPGLFNSIVADTSNSNIIHIKNINLSGIAKIGLMGNSSTSNIEQVSFSGEVEGEGGPLSKAGGLLARHIGNIKNCRGQNITLNCAAD